jgi:hypothetical protein
MEAPSRGSASLTSNVDGIALIQIEEARIPALTAEWSLEEIDEGDLE